MQSASHGTDVGRCSQAYHQRDYYCREILPHGRRVGTHTSNSVTNWGCTIIPHVQPNSTTDRSAVRDTYMRCGCPWDTCICRVGTSTPSSSRDTPSRARSASLRRSARPSGASPFPSCRRRMLQRPLLPLPLRRLPPTQQRPLQAPRTRQEPGRPQAATWHRSHQSSPCNRIDHTCGGMNIIEAFGLSYLSANHALKKENTGTCSTAPITALETIRNEYSG